MTISNSKDFIRKMINELKTNPDILISNLNEGNEVNENDVVYLKADVSAVFNNLNEFDDELIQLPDQIDLRWESTKKQEKISGECSFTNYAVALNANFLQANPAVNLINYDNYRYFDDHPFSGDGWLVVYKIGQSISASKLYLFHNDKFYQLDLDIRAYIEMLYISKGFYYWQFLFLGEDNKQLAREMADHLSVSLFALKHLFPETDISVLEDRLNSLKI